MRDPLWLASWAGWQRVSSLLRDSDGEASSWEASGSRVAKPPGVLCPASLSLWLLSLRISGAADFGAPTARAALENMSVMEQAVQHGGDGGTIAEQLAPVVDWSVRCDQRARPLIAAHDDLQQFLGGGQRQLAHSQIIDDQQGHAGQ